MKLTAVLLVLVAPALAAGPKLVLEPVVKQGLEEPVDVAVAPGEPARLYVVEQAGRIVVAENGKVLPKPLLDIRSRVLSGGELGLLGVAFHPGFAKNRRYFVNYTAERDSKMVTVIAEFTAGDGKEKKLIEFEQPFSNHNGGGLAFGPDGFLYIAAGDGGSGGDPRNHGQNKESWLGKLHRIDVDKPGKGMPYGIPADNPFAKGGGRGEVFAYGLRNPWRFSFDPRTGLLYAADVGQNRWEEIDIVEKGGNYGWNVMEGTHCFGAQVCDSKGLVLPIHEYGRREGISITGGFVYRGKKIPELDGTYVYSDFSSGRIWGLRYDPKARKAENNRLLIDSNLPVSSFGVDAEGELLVVVYHGSIRRIAKAKP